VIEHELAHQFGSRKLDEIDVVLWCCGFAVMLWI